MSQFLIQTTVDTRERCASVLATSTFLDHALMGSVDRTVRYVNPLTYAEDSFKQGHARGVTCLAISDCIQAQAPLICSASRDGMVCFWAPRKAEVIRKVTPRCQEIKTMSIFQYGSVGYLILGTKDGLVLIYDTSTDILIKTLLGHRCGVLCSAVSYRGSFCDGEPLNTRYISIATGGKDKTVRVWDFDSGKRRRKLKHPRLVSCLALAKESVKPVLISGCADGCLYLWDIRMGVILRTFEGHMEKIYSVCIWETHEILVASCSADNTIRIFDALSGECVCTLLGHKRLIRQIAMFTDYESSYSVLISCGMDRTWRLWDITNVLNTYFYPPLPDDFDPETMNEEDILTGRNEVPADNPDFTYTGKDGKLKHGSTKAFVREVIEDSEEEGGEDNDEDFDLSDGEDVDYGDDNEEGNDQNKRGVGGGWGAKKKNLLLNGNSGDNSVGLSKVASSAAVGVSDSTVLPLESLGIAGSMNTLSLDTGESELLLEPSQCALDSARESHTVSHDGVTPPPYLLSPTLTILSPQALQRQSEALQQKFVQALATVQVEHAREKSRQSEILSMRLSHRARNKSMNVQDDGGSGNANNLSPLTINAPIRPIAPVSTSALKSPRLIRKRGQGGSMSECDSIERSNDRNNSTSSDGSMTPPSVPVSRATTLENEVCHFDIKDRIKKEHEIHTTRHTSRLTVAQQRSAARLASRLQTQANKKFRMLSVMEKQKLREETEKNSDDEYDGTNNAEEEEDEDDD